MNFHDLCVMQLKNLLLLTILILAGQFQSCTKASGENSSAPCNRIEIEFLHDNEPVMQVRGEVVSPLEDYFNAQEGVEEVTMSVMGNSAKIWLNFNHNDVTGKTVSAVYEQVQKLVGDGTLPGYLEGPYVSGCGVEFPKGGKGEKEKVFTSLEEALNTPDKVYKLDLYYQKLTELPESIGELKNVTSLRLGGNKFTTLPSSIGQLTHLKSLNLERNELTSLPESIGQLSNLSTLILEDNQLTTLPASIGNLSNLKKLNLRDNQFVDLPEAVGNLANLTFLDIAKNRLTTLPESIGGLKQLDFMNACSNALDILPDAMGQLENVSEIYLSDNRLKEIPASMGGLSKLTNLYMEVNPLSAREKLEIEGIVPDSKVKF